ncbi:pyrroline-5-carboxylate reductase [Oceanospirillum sp.]|uniref:pyrroline-5-carboxylate reductase n=1 Tax=Oceanospirillum sp. TaxID=2021254 RepID=UPI003A94C024
MQAVKLAFLGAGNMSGSIIGGLIAKGVPAENIIATRRSEERLSELKSQFNITTSSDNNAAVAKSDVVILGVKPQMMQELCSEIREQVQKSKPLIVSVAAGLKSETLERWLGGDVAVVRTMPNTPSLLGCGATGLYANSKVTGIQQELAEKLMQAVGLALWVEDEAQMDAVTAVSGSGPAYFFLAMEALQKAGESVGLSAEVAEKLAIQTALGAARMASESEDDAAELRRRVTSPGGTTEQALNTFNDGGLTELYRKAVKAAANRGQELANQLDH